MIDIFCQFFMYEILPRLSPSCHEHVLSLGTCPELQLWRELLCG